jgi:hypothetical protein
MCGGILAFGCDLLPAFRHRRTAFGLIEIAGCAREMQMHRAEARLLDIRRILCPVDFSDASRHAWDHAVVIAGWYGASITALHVCNPVFPAEPPISFAELPRTTQRLTGADRRELEADLAPWLESAHAGRVVTDVVFDEGHCHGRPWAKRPGSDALWIDDKPGRTTSALSGRDPEALRERVRWRSSPRPTTPFCSG